MSAPQMTTAEALRAALASTIACSAQELQEAVGQVVVAAASELPESAPAGADARSVFDPQARTTVLLADRIPAGQEAQALAEEIERHHGRQAAQAVLGDRVAELLGGDGKVAERILPATSVIEYRALLDRWRAADGTAKSSDITDSIRAAAADEVEAVSEALRRSPFGFDAEGGLAERNLAERILPATSVIEYRALLDRWRAADGTAKSSDITDSIRAAAADEVEAVSEALRRSPFGFDAEGGLAERNLSNYIEHPASGQPQEHFLNTDPSVIEAKVMKDYAHFLGKDVLVSRISGFVGDDSTDIELSPPAKVRVETTSEQSLKRWIDGWCDPVYEVVLVEDHPQLACVRSLWIHGPSLHLNGKQTEVSDIVSIAEPIAPRHDDTPSP